MSGRIADIIAILETIGRETAAFFRALSPQQLATPIQSEDEIRQAQTVRTTS